MTGATLGNGVAESFTYDAQRLMLSGHTATKSGATLMSLTYSYQAQAGQNGAGTLAGNSGQLMSVTGTVCSQTESASCTYDLQGRLATSSQTTGGG